LRTRPFPEKWLTLIQRHAVFFRRLSASDRAELLDHIQIFLAEKRFEGCGGFAITDEVRVTIAAQACLLLLHRRTDYFPGLHDSLLSIDLLGVRNTTGWRACLGRGDCESPWRDWP
jgi:Mlc titration factor MtfA (ptsG expression regulator)